MESSEIIEKILNPNVFGKAYAKNIEEKEYKKIQKYLVGLRFKPSAMKIKIPIWKLAVDKIDADSIVFNFCTDEPYHDTISYFQKFHESFSYYLFHGKHVSFVPDESGNLFHWTECYKNIFSYQTPSEENISSCLTSISQKEKIKLIHVGIINPDTLKCILKSMNEIILNNQPYILFENFIEGYDFGNKKAKYYLKKEKLNLFETKTFRIFKDYANEKNINFDVVCSTLPDDSSVLLKIKTS